MRPSTDHVSPQLAPVRPQEHDLHTLQSRVSAEFREMPGLRLTLAQASRLFSIDPGRCERVLGALVEGGVLATSGDAFARADSGARYA
jgi:hypothetical protein